MGLSESSSKEAAALILIGKVFETQRSRSDAQASRGCFRSALAVVWSSVIIAGKPCFNVTIISWKNWTILRKTIQRIKTGLQTHPSRLLIVAACLHLAATISVFAIGRLSLMPSQFDRDGVGEFAADGHTHLLDTVLLTRKLGSDGIIAWLSAVAPLHVRAYSLSQVMFSRWIGFNILSIEPINLFYYLAILAMVYKLAEAVFDRRAALLAATVVALWPTWLIHTTQPLRDPLLITLVLTLLLIMRHLLTQTFSWRQTITAGGGGALILLMIWIVRLSMWDIMRAVVGLGFVLVVLRQVKERRLICNVISGAMLIVVLWLIPQFNQLLQFTEKREADSGRVLIGEEVVELSLWDRIAARREGFIKRESDEGYKAGSDVDSDVRFHNKGELIRYLPRAAAIGFFAPFPNMWFAEGLLVGRAGRWLSGFEMLLTYILEALAVIGVWQKRRQFLAWLLTFSAILGATALGLIVINIGSLYRLRYSYWILLVILGAGGMVHVLSKRRPREPQNLLARAI